MSRATTRALSIAAVLALPLLAACGSDSDESDSSGSSGGDGSSAAADGTCEYVAEGDAAREVDAPPTEATLTEPTSAVITTSNGDLDITLNGDTTPCTVNSFVSLAEQGFYDDTPCPRITTTPGFELLQCGDPSGTTAGGPGYSFADELSGDETYGAGTLAMANAGPDTQGSQFFIVYGDTQLPPSYTVFGTVDPADLGVIEEIAADGDDGSNPAGGGAPNTPVDIVSVTIG
ncbi:peptidylprolyl isomerase [Nocardioides alkalitolerans]|uniref:peptidylprolyl isomerase n=1 Tax=Nocardioides alkalitolerans TaxID=281714 RepID=UPI0004211D50|nr:peptidylprolyl isomerase [Nocardioides alkalitolerans]